jgi:hypothetical protein
MDITAPISMPAPARLFKFPLKEAKLFDGVIAHRTLKYGDNIHDKGTVTVKTESVCDRRDYTLRNGADFTFDL